MIKQMYKYSLSLKHHWLNARPALLYIIGAIICVFALKYKFGPDDIINYIKVSALIFSFFLVPQMIIHLRYYWLNDGYIFYYNPNEQKIRISIERGEEVEFTFSDIQLVKHYKGISLAEKKIQFYPWDNYNFSRIYLKNGKQFLITSLLVPNMELPLESGKIELYKIAYAYPLTKEKPLTEKQQ